MTDGFGSITWWGFTPCLDLQDKDLSVALEKFKLSVKGKDELNVLLVGAGDCRHLLKTLSQSYKHAKTKINFYILESSLELYARTMLLLSVAMETPARMGLQEKTEFFLEIFGNSLVRQQTTEYIIKMSNEFIKMVTDFDYLEKKLPIFDLSLLKFKERDFLEGIFKFWRHPGRDLFEVEKCWELRLRKYLGPRYDAIPNVFDWDFNMKLVDRGAAIIGSRPYQNWRRTGVAFEIRDGTYDVPNKTLASGMVFKVEGERHPRRGYWGDILVSPFIAFGIECEEKSFFKKSNNMYTQSSQHVSEYNMLAMLSELLNKEKYVPPKTDDATDSNDTNQTATLTEILEEDEELAEELQHKEANTNDDGKAPQDKEFEALPMDGVKICFLPLGSLPDLHKKSRFHKLFDAAYFSNSMVHLLKPEITEMFADNASVVVESAKFMVELKTEQYCEYAKKIAGFATQAGCKTSGPVDEKMDNFFRFTYQRPDS